MTVSVTRLDLISIRNFRTELILSSLGINLLSLALPLALLQIYDRIIPNEALGTVLVLVSGVATAMVLEAILRLARGHLVGLVAARWEHCAHVAAFEHLLGTDLGVFESIGPGQHLERFNALGALRDAYSGQAFLVTVDLPFVLLYLGLIAYLGGTLVLVPLTACGVLAGVVGITILLLRRCLTRQHHAEEVRQNLLIAIINGILTIKMMGMEALMKRRYGEVQEARGAAVMTVELVAGHAQDLVALVGAWSSVALVGYGAWLVTTGTLSMGVLTACTTLAGRALQPIQTAMGMWTRMQGIQAACQQIDALFAMPVATRPDIRAPREPSAYPGRIDLRDVHYRFSATGPDALNGVSLTVRPGEMVGIVGPNGAGKTVLISLIRGLITPTAGRVLIDGHEVSSLDPETSRQVIAYIPQQEALFRGTLMDNITMFRPELVSAGHAAAEMLGLARDVNRLPLGFETQVGEGIVDQLSRGVGQRICIARALVGRPHILLFDEANSAIDIAGDIALAETIRRLRGKVTIVLVSYRPSNLALAHHIYGLRDGVLEKTDEGLVGDGGTL